MKHQKLCICLLALTLCLCFALPGFVSAEAATDEEAAQFEEELRLAETGDASAMNNVGYFYEYGLGVTEDQVKATEWYKKGAEAGDAAAMSNLCIRYLCGRGVARDEDEALRWGNAAVEHGDDAALIDVADCYAKRSEPDYAKAFALYQESLGIVLLHPIAVVIAFA